MEISGEHSRSFKRRQRRKKQQERLRIEQEHPTPGSSDSTAREPQAAPDIGTIHPHGTPGVAATAATTEENGPVSTDDSLATLPPPPAVGTSLQNPVQGSTSTTHRTKSGSAKRRRRKAAAAAAAAEDTVDTAASGVGAAAEPAQKPESVVPPPAVAAIRPASVSVTRPAVAAIRPASEPVTRPAVAAISPASEPVTRPAVAAIRPAAEPITHPVSQSAGEAPSPAQVSHAEPAEPGVVGPTCSALGDPNSPVSQRSRRETSPVTSSTEQVLQSIRRLQTELGQLRGRLLESPRRAHQPPPAEMAPPVQPASDAAAAPTLLTDVVSAHPDAQDGQQKTKEQIRAERKAKAEAAKLAKAAKAKEKKQQQTVADAAGDKVAVPASADGSSEPAPPAAAAPRQPLENAPPEKSKAELKAERRAKQEAQRAAKAAAASEAAAAKTAAAPQKGARPADKPSPAAPQGQEFHKSDKKPRKAAAPAAPKKGLQMFSHLPQFDVDAVDTLRRRHSVHPAVVRLCLRLARGRVTGCNAGAVALLSALAAVIDDYSTPAQKELRRDLPEQVRRAVGHVTECRPLTIAMENVAVYLDRLIRSEVPDGATDAEAKRVILDGIESYIQDNICKAVTAITNYAEAKIGDNDTILTFGRSTTVLDVLVSARRAGLKFGVVVVDSRPRLEGRQMLRQLLDAGVPCTYGLISALSHLMKEATKVMLGAHALLSNGMVVSPAGSALVSLTGHAANRPVLVCCETYKFSERVQTDSQVFNQLGDPDELVGGADSPLAGWHQSESLSLLNLRYDVTPPELVDVVVTELGAIPCTSVPAVLRLQQHAGY